MALKLALALLFVIEVTKYGGATSTSTMEAPTTTAGDTESSSTEATTALGETGSSSTEATTGELASVTTTMSSNTTNPDNGSGVRNIDMTSLITALFASIYCLLMF